VHLVMPIAFSALLVLAVVLLFLPMGVLIVRRMTPPGPGEMRLARTPLPLVFRPAPVRRAAIVAASRRLRAPPTFSAHATGLGSDQFGRN
jgi:hypothetical protein